MKFKHLSKLKLVVVVAVLALLGAGCYGQDQQLLRPKVESESTLPTEYYNTPLTVGNQNLMVEVVNTEASREQGLSKRLSISDKNGMLFDFTNTNSSRPSFWMKDMNFAIDIVWINNGKIVGISANALAPTADMKTDDSKLPLYSPPSNITHVLEVASGWCERNNIKVGDSVQSTAQ